MKITENAAKHKMHDIAVAAKNRLICSDCGVAVAIFDTRSQNKEEIIERITKISEVRGIPGILTAQKNYIAEEYESVRIRNLADEVEFIVMILEEIDEMWCRIITLRDKEWGAILGFLDEYNGHVVYHYNAKKDRIGVSLEHLGKKYHLKDGGILKESKAHEICNIDGRKERSTKEEFKVELRNTGIAVSSLVDAGYGKVQTMRYIEGEYLGTRYRVGKEIGDQVELEDTNGAIVPVDKGKVTKIRIRGI